MTIHSDLHGGTVLDTGWNPVPLKTVAPRPMPRGFTLVELMVSVALMLILILGVNQVFRITSDTVGAGQTFSAAVRDNRAIQATFAQDFRSAMAFDTPFLTLNMTVTPAFRNRADQAGDRDYNPTASIAQQRQQILTIDMDEDGTEGEPAVPGEIVNLSTYNDRNHRTDVLNFFASDFFRRQTGNDGTYVSSTTSNEALISYGHLRVYDGGADTAATELALSGGGNTTPDANDGRYPRPGRPPLANDPNPNNFYASDWVLGRVQILLKEDLQPVPPGIEHHIFRATGATGLSPLMRNSWTTQQRPDSNERYFIQHHRFDLAATSVAQFRGILEDFIFLNPTDAWWDELNYRFATNPFVIKPLESRKVALATPIFVTGCTQFIVEFAGDFVTQHPTTHVIVPGSMGDGTIDYIAQPIVGTTRFTRTIRWYGLPRDVSSNFEGSFAGRPDGIIEDAYDVVPVNNLRPITSLPPTYVPFEKVVPSETNFQYFCAWGPSDMAKTSTERPQMFRITLTIDEPAGRLPEGQTSEYVLKLGL